VRGADAVARGGETAWTRTSLLIFSTTGKIIAARRPRSGLCVDQAARSPTCHPLTDVIENIVVDRVGNYVAFPLRSSPTPKNQKNKNAPELRSELTSSSSQTARSSTSSPSRCPSPACGCVGDVTGACRDESERRDSRGEQEVRTETAEAPD